MPLSFTSLSLLILFIPQCLNAIANQKIQLRKNLVRYLNLNFTFIFQERNSRNPGIVEHSGFPVVFLHILIAICDLPDHHWIRIER